MRTPDQDLICTFLTIQGAEECPLLANKRSLSHAAGTSALPPATDIQKDDVRFVIDYFRFTSRSRPFWRVSQASGFDPQRTFASLRNLAAVNQKSQELGDHRFAAEVRDTLLEPEDIIGLAGCTRKA